MVNQVDLNKAETFYKEVMKFYHPDFALAENDPLYDITVRTAKLYKIPEMIAIKAEVKQNRSLLFTSTTTAAYDELLANYFIDRNLGSYKTITVKYIFETADRAFKINQNTPFIIGSTTFYTISDQEISPASYALETSPPYKDKYSILVSCRSTTIGEVNDVNEGVSAPTDVAPGATAAFVSFATGGGNSESNIDAYTRGRHQISVRNLINDRSIKAFLLQQFPGSFNEVLNVGMGEPEMVRDLIITKIPKYQIRLVFASPTVVNIVPATTRFLYKGRPDLIYVPSQSMSVNASSPVWLHNTILNNYSFLVDVELASVENPLGFVQDEQMITQFSAPVVGFLGSRANIGFWEEEIGGQALIHLGSMTDVYLKAPSETRTIKLFVNPLDQGFISFPNDIGPVLRVNSVVDEQSNPVLFFDFDIQPNSSSLRFSGKDPTRLFVNPGLVGTTISAEVVCTPIVRAVQQEMDADLERVLDSNTLAKTMFPVFVDGIIQIALEPSAASFTGTNDSLNAAIQNYMFTAGGQVVRSKIMEIVYQVVSNAKAIVSLDMRGTQIMPGGEEIPLVSGEFVRPVLNSVLGISNRNVQFIKGDWQFVYIT